MAEGAYTTRRALIGAATSVTVIAATGGASTASRLDAELLDIGRNFEGLRGKLQTADAEVDRVAAAAFPNGFFYKNPPGVDPDVYLAELIDYELKSGFTAARERADGILSALNQLADRAREITATSLPGLIVKARIAEYEISPGSALNDELHQDTLSLIKNIINLQGFTHQLRG